MSFLIRLGTALYHTGIRLAAPFVPKARLWVDGRNALWQRLEAKAAALQGCLWVHCASVGEFEQARPILEVLEREQPDLPILVTFFSPSGYEARKNFPTVTHVEYLPPDTPANAERLLALVLPSVAIFIKYEFWHEHLKALQRKGVPTFLVSAIFRHAQPFFRWYGGAHRTMLGCFTRLFVQDEASRVLLKEIGVENVTVTGDTRFDRVAAIGSQDPTLPIADAFRRSSDSLVLVAGSTWPADEHMIRDAITGLPELLRTVIVPHELEASHLEQLMATFPGPVARWSGCEDALDTSSTTAAELPLNASTLLVDRMGLLSRLYKYADITYVGGGFGTGIHNLLEAATWGKPVIFGPNHQRFAEAHGLIEHGAGFPVKNATELRSVLELFLRDPEALDKASKAAAQFVKSRTGATRHVVQAVLPLLR